jgi:hypothetical protein
MMGPVPTVPAPTTGRPRPRVARVRVALAALVALGAACAEPALPDNAELEGAEEPLGVATPDPARDALVDELEALRGHLAETRDRLAAAVDADDAATARRHADAALELFVGQGDGGDPLFPTVTLERGSELADDRLTRTLTAARDAGGTLGRATLELLRDPLAGDLGTWQRDPGGVVALVEATATPATDLAALEAAVLELPGEGTRALAWTLLTAEARDLDAARASAERGVAHLDIVVAAVDDLLADGDGS